MARANLLSLFDQFPAIGHDTAVIQTRGYRRQRFTYAELTAKALSLSYILASHSIGPGDRLLLWGPNSFEWVACFWAILLRGAVVVPMDAAATVEFVQRVTHDSRVRLILRDAGQPEIPDARPNLVYNGLPVSTQSADNSASRRLTRTDLAEILFTSGTTSEPRGVVLTHGNFLANVEPLERGIDEYRKYERWAHPLRFVSAVPLSHVFGQFMGVFVPPLLGATIVFENSTLPTEILRTIKQESATALIVVPRMLDTVRTALEQLIDSRGWRRWFTAAYSRAIGEPFLRRVWRFRRLHSHPGWKFWAFISGGAALSSETEEFFKRIGYAVVQGYGMTETASLISLNHPFRATKGSVGKVLPGREFCLAEDGEILVRGENVSSGYWEKGTVRTSGDNGWLHTGDLGELDVDGNLRFRGRKKNVIVTPAGLNVYPEDLETALRKQPAVRDAAVIPLDISGNAEPCAALLVQNLVNPNETWDLSSSYAEELARGAIDAANTSLADYQRIRRWILWPEPDFPRTPTGKPRLSLIASRAAELLVPGNPSAVRAALSTVKSRETRDLLSSAIPSTPLTSLPANLDDLSSLDRVELLTSLEHRYHIELNETAFANAKSPADIRQLLAQPSARRSDFVYPRWTQRAPIRLLRVVIYYALGWPPTLILAHPRIRGREHLAGLEGPVLFVANHTTRKADIGMVLYALAPRFRHRLATAMGGETLQEFRQPPREWFFAKRWLWQLGYFLLVSLFNVFPLPRFSGFRESFRFAGETADRGYNLLVFPEGIINDRDSPAMAAFQPGIGLLAQNLNIPIVPMRMDGVWQMKQKRRHLARLGELTIHIGTPVIFPPDTPPAEIATCLKQLVESL